MTPSGKIITKPAQSKTIYNSQIEENEPQFEATDTYYQIVVPVELDIIVGEMDDDEFLTLSLNSGSFDFWKTEKDDDLVDKTRLKPI
jgi:hypothetical protein